MTRTVSEHAEVKLPKCPTGIQGLDEITDGGLPAGRPTLVCGSAGSGKTLLAMEFLARGALEYGEPGLFISFEENERELVENVRSFGWGVEALVEQRKLLLDYVYIEPAEIEETGDYSLEGLFIRLEHAVGAIGAKRVALDTLEALFGGFTNEAIMRAELRRLFRWLKDKGVTAVVTGEPGSGTLTRYGIEEYVSDCVLALDHRVTEQIAIRRLRVVKYRGSSHGVNEYPFLIGQRGLSVLPITSLGLDYGVSMERISTGIPRLDAMLGEEGFYRGASILVSGTAGTGKTSVAASFAHAACARGERCLYFSFEEPPAPIIRNMRSVGIDLQPWVESDVLKFHAMRCAKDGLEAHLITIHNLIDTFDPRVVVIDPISNLTSVSAPADARSMLTRVIDYLKRKGTTAVFTDLTHGGNAFEATETEISSLMDTWILLRDIESGGERNRGLYVLKSRGMAHSNQIREFLLTDGGIALLDVYAGPEGVLMGTARTSREAREQAEQLLREQEIARRKRGVTRKRTALEAQIAALQAEIQAEGDDLDRAIEEAQHQEEMLSADRERMARARGMDASASE